MPSLDNARTPVSEIERVKLEIATLSDELSTALSDSVYAPMSEGQRRMYDGKCQELKRLVEELKRLRLAQIHEPGAA